MPRRRKADVGRVDGGEGRGVRLGGSDTARRPTGYLRAEDTFDDDETALNESEVTVDDYAHLIDDGIDDSPSDRRRDPLRK